MNKKQNCKYYDKYENACRISSCSCGATLRECEDDSDSLVDVIVTGASIAVGLGNLFDSDSQQTGTASYSDAYVRELVK